MANKKYSINTLMSYVPDGDVSEVKLDGDMFKDVSITVKRTLTLDEALGFVQSIVSLCTDDEDASYSPELFDFAVRMYVVMYYSNIDLSKDAKKAYRVLYNTNLFEQIYAHVESQQAGNLILSAERKIDHWRNIMSASVASKVSDMMKKMDAVIDGSEQMLEAIDGNEFKAAVDRLANMGVLEINQQDSAPKQIDMNDSITKSVTPEDIAKANELMAGLSQKTAPAGSGNVVYMKKKK